MTGTTVGVLGLLVMAAGFTLAWPQPAYLASVATLTSAAALVIAFRARIPEAQAVAGCLAIFAYLVLALVVIDPELGRQVERATQLLNALLSGLAGQLLVPATIMTAIFSALLRRRGLAEHGRWLLKAGVPAAAACVVLVGWHGLGRTGDPQHVAAIYLLYGVAAMAAAPFLRRRRGLAGLAAWGGAGLMLVSLLQGSAFLLGWTWTNTLLATATITGIAAVAAWRARRTAWILYGGPAVTTLWATSLSAALLLATGLSEDELPWTSLRAAWLGVLWLALAFVGGNRLLFGLGQGATAAAAAVWAVHAAGLEAGAVVRIQHVAVALSLAAAVWAALRTGARPTVRRTTEPPVDSAASPNEHGAWNPFQLAGMATPDGALKVAGGRALTLLRSGTIGFDQILAYTMLFVLVGLTGFSSVRLIRMEWVRFASEMEVSAAVVTALGAGSWLLLATVATTLVLILLGARPPVARFSPAALVLAAGTAIPLLAAFSAGGYAVASAARWWAGGFVLLASAVLWLRSPFAVLVIRSGLLPPETARSLQEPWQTRIFGALVLSIGGGVILTLTLLPLALSLTGMRIEGPDEASVFGRMGLMTLYAVPLGMLAAAFVGHAVRERRGGYAYAGALLGNLAVTLGYSLAVATAQQSIGGVEIIRLLQLNAAWSGAFALGWLGALAAAGSRPSAWPRRQALTAAPLVAAFILPSMSILLADPAAGHAVVAAGGHAWGWIAWAVTLLGMLLVERRKPPTRVVAFAAVAAAALTGMSVAGVQPTAAYTTLVIFMTVIAWASLAAVWAVREGASAKSSSDAGAGPADLVWSTAATATTAAVLAARGVFSGLDFGGWAAWWAAGPMVAVAGLFYFLSLLSRRTALGESAPAARNCAWAGLVVLNSAAMLLWWLHWGIGATSPAVWTAGLIAVQTIALLPSSAVSLIVDRRVREGVPSPSWPPVHLGAAGFAVVATVNMVFVRVAEPPIDFLSWGALHAAALSIAVLITAMCLWDVRGRYAAHGLYVLLLAAGVLALDAARPTVAWLHWWASVGPGIVALLGGLFWTTRGRWRLLMRSVGAVARTADPRLWLLGVTTFLAIIQSLNALSVALGHPAPPSGASDATVTAWRVSAASAPFLTATAFTLLASTRRTEAAHHLALVAGALAAVLWGWAWIDPEGLYAHDVQRAAVVFFTLFAVTVVYGAVLYRRAAASSPWAAALRGSIHWLVPAAAVALAATILHEAVGYLLDGEVVLPIVTVLGVTVALTGAATLGLLWAVAPRKDPLQLPERRRVAYVYAAEILLALAIVHLRLTVPNIFAGFFDPYWPLLVMALAFAGVGLGAWFERRGLNVLAGPLSRTAMFLPLLPLLGFWAAGSRIHYSALLLIVGTLYAVLAVTRRSFLLAVLAALASNSALWYVLQQTEGYGLLDHPQIWLIPFALSVLTAGYLNRGRLTPLQMATVRYFCVSLVYLSSTAEMFLQGVAEAPWLPLVLAGLAVGGVFAGIVLRVQSFLFLGCGFLVLALLTILWHASTNLGWTWVWYVAGILLGLLILFVFAVFERQRQRVLDGLGTLRGWET